MLIISCTRRLTTGRMTMKLHRFPSWLLALALAVAIFILDLLTPLGVVIWVLYIVPILIIFRSEQPRSILIAAGAATLLVVIGFVLSPPGLAQELALLNRCLGTGVLWITIIALVRQQRLTASLHHERDLSESILNSLPGVFFLYDEHGRFLRWNKQFEQVTGYSSTEMRERHPLDFFTGEEKELLAERIGAVFRDGAAEVEANFVAKNGTRTPYYFNGVRAEIEGRPHLIGMGIDITQRSRAEAALHESEGRYRTLFEYAPVGIVIANPDSYYVDANASICSMLGYTREEFIGLHASDIVAPAETAHIDTALEELHNRADHQREWHFRRKDGTTFAAEVIATMMPDGYLMGMIRDITDRKAADDYRARLAAIVESSVDAIISIDLHGMIVSWNKGAQQIFGYPARAMIGTPIARLAPDDRAEEGRSISERIAQGQSVKRFETLRLTSDGRLVNVSISASPLRSSDGRVSGASLIARDISELKERENEVARLSRLYAALSQINQAIVWTEDRDALFQKVCQALVDDGGFCMAWVGWNNPETHQITPVAQWGDEQGYLQQISVYSDDRPEGRGPSGTAFRTGQAYINNDIRYDPATLPWRAERARYGFHSSAAFPIRTQNAVIGTLNVYADQPGFFHEKEIALLDEAAADLSFALDNFAREEARRAAEQALRELNDTLEQTVAQRTAEMQKALSRAEAADRIKSAFLATMSHELRTPLNSIIGFTGIILQGLAGPLTEEQSKQLEMVRGSARHLLALINDVLDISKIEAGQLEIARAPFDIKRSITRAIDLVTPLAGKKGLALRYSIAPELGEAVSDERRFEQILINLLSNAIKFTPQGEVSLSAQYLRDYAPPGGAATQPAVRLEIHDTGIGIKPDDLATLFQPFRQIDTGLARTHEGTGLGLAICRRLATLMGGEIAATSTWGQGSTFSVTLPLKGSTPA
jgi:PAS domain S-box-containing protein